MKPSEDKVRRVEAVDTAEDMFWASIAADYPEINSGDFPPELAMAMSEQLLRHVKVWLELNEKPEVKKNVEILLHNIEYSYHEGGDITDSDMEEIAYKISQGVSGSEFLGAIHQVVGEWHIAK